MRLLFRARVSHLNKSVFYDLSQTTERSKQSNTAGGSARSRSIEAAARKAKLEVEKHFLEKDHEMRKLQLSKEISLAEADENAMNRILKEENNDLKTNSHADRKSLIGTAKEDDHRDKSDKTDGHADRKPLIGTAKEDDRNDDYNGDKFTYQEKGKQPIKMNPYSPQFTPKLDPSKMEPSTSVELKPNIKVEQNQEPGRNGT